MTEKKRRGFAPLAGRVKGHCMEPTIQDGADLWYDGRLEVSEGDIVVVFLKSKDYLDITPIKRLGKVDHENRRYILHTDNPEYDDWVLSMDEVDGMARVVDPPGYDYLTYEYVRHNPDLVGIDENDCLFFK